MGIWKSFITGLPTLNLSDFETPLSQEKKETLLSYALFIATNGKAFANGASPPQYEIRRRLAGLGLDPEDVIGIRSYVIRNGLMSAWR